MSLLELVHQTPLTGGDSADAVEGIENLVLSFLSQLSLSLPPVQNSDDEDEDASARKKTKPQKIELQLADRKKITASGCVPFTYISFNFRSGDISQVHGDALSALSTESQTFR